MVRFMMDSDLLRPLLLLAIALLFVGAFNYARNKRRLNQRETVRRYAIHQGLVVEGVERDTIWSQGIRRGKGLRTFTVPRYSVKPRHHHDATWSLLQRWKEKRTSLLPGHWLLQTEAGEPTQAQMRVLKEIALDQQWAEEFLEIEYQPDRISVFWDETGIEDAQKVLGYLRQLDG